LAIGRLPNALSAEVGIGAKSVNGLFWLHKWGCLGAMLDTDGLGRLIEVLIERGYRVVGPTLRDNAIVLAELSSADELPRGWGVETAPGHYRVRPRDDDAVFGHSAGPQSWKQFLHPPRRRLWSGGRDGVSDTEPGESPRHAFLGVGPARALPLSSTRRS
jgi:hypothetical protein